MLHGFDGLKGYILGEHLPHTFSPKIHSYFADYYYGKVELEREHLAKFISSGEFDFLNVTIPYKKEIIPYLTSLSPEASQIGAVNTVKKMSDGSLVGYNTDYYGFEYTLKKSGISLNNAKVLVLGSGGASMPIRAALRANGAREIIIISRSGEDNYENISKHSDAEIIVNTTPLGMYPDNGVSPVDLNTFTACRGVIDIVYNPSLTKLLLDAEKRGISHIGGLYMLVAQAKCAAEIFTNAIIDDSEIDRICKLIEAETKNIILIGMPGCGKSSVGKLVAETLSRPFFDADLVFYDKFGISPADTINKYGEEEFRNMEHNVILELGKMSGAIIACGGGVVTRDENYAPLHQNGTIFYIERKLENLKTEGRPLSQSEGVSTLYQKRLPMYNRFCDYKIVSNEIKLDTVNKIIDAVKAGI